MTQLSDLEFLKLSKGQKFGYRLGRFFTGIPKAIGNFFLMAMNVDLAADRAAAADLIRRFGLCEVKYVARRRLMTEG